ncbi:acetyl-CoA synthetase-like protein [Basidiobolus meristosporus CBS 931.73]|uniref:Acetyl-CoA synthetase-like protein n=1 Tax=Basidiobolus meristosporus CBS 931.73 TaxID=1314790 RepID=A0A1Y1Y595_9FUNG|nr:acetyl-CoA synthetase-like protein [Basidiobolus meristosporus CBS 931.73]ORX93065.1 acetyl-CoA synthetase-like protein [Basidiobolus meristosporus CBS 931.73]|eukprot:ORX64916.1 acetyl-CoA synthetase-like protein [Basidiobolus meristosporus CBS 931.73]
MVNKSLSVEVGTEKPQNETLPRRNHLSPDALLSRPREDITTLADLLPYLIRTRGKKKALGYRKVEKIIEEQKEVTKNVGGVMKKEVKKWKYSQLGPYNWFTYEEVDRIAREIGCGLLKLGLTAGDKITIFNKTSPDWYIMSQACFSQSMTIVTAYETLGAEGLKHALNEGEITTLFTNADLLPVTQSIANQVPTLKNVIYTDEANPTLIDSFKRDFPEIGIHTYEEVRQLGEQNLVEKNLPQPDDVACIMYTSGSTGNPKGVMITHANVVASIAAVDKWIGPILKADSDVIIAYLPLAHIFEFAVENYIVFKGMPIGYSSPRTLTDASVRNCKGDLRELCPTIMCGVPAVWETIRKSVMSQVQTSGKLARVVFDLAFRNKNFLKNVGIPSGIWDTVVFNKIKKATGGRLRYALSGGAPIAPETQAFLTTCICTVLQAYGMTEATAMAAIMNPDVKVLKSNGPPVPCAEIKLVDVPEANYLSSNNPPQGEVWVRGPAVMKGYFKNEELTKEILNEDGWLMTGDIGEWLPDGTLGIIDRKKNLVKLSNGEYIALEKLESLYKTSAYADNICVYANSFQARPVAILVCAEEKLRKLAKQRNVSGSESMSHLELTQNAEVKKAVLDDLLAIAKRNDFVSAELLHAIHIVDEEWTPENNLLTAAQKLKRRDIADRYKEHIDAMYQI